MLGRVEAGAFFLVAGFGALVGVIVHRFFFSGGLFTGGRVRIPKHLAVVDVLPSELPADARAPVTYLTQRLETLGFASGASAVRVPVLQRFGHRLILVPFVHEAESTVFLMGIDVQWRPRTELMLHLVTPLSDGRRVETTTLGALRHLRGPATADVRVVTDAASVDEIWAHHRRALMAHERKDRAPVTVDAWQPLVTQAYAAWIEAAVRAQRLSLDASGLTYTLRRVF
jgi:hypothetical protein